MFMRRNDHAMAQTKRERRFWPLSFELVAPVELLLGRLVFYLHRCDLGGLEADPVNPGTTTTRYTC